MEFSNQKKELLEQGNRLLGFVKKKNLGMDTIVDILEEPHLSELNEWFFDVEEFVERNGLDVHKRRLTDADRIINGERVSVERITSIISIIDRINN